MPAIAHERVAYADDIFVIGPGVTASGNHEGEGAEKGC